MTTTIVDQEFNSVLTGVVCVNLYREHIDKMYKTCKIFKTMIDDEWKMIYHDCQHHQPHNPGEYDEPIIDKYGDQHWYKEGSVHRDQDRPAVIEANSTQWWFMEGELHRDQDQPAIIKTSGYQAWYSGGKRHRDGDLPAVIEADGTQHWYRWDQRHRNRDRPAIIWSDGYQLWYRNGVQT